MLHDNYNTFGKSMSYLVIILTTVLIGGIVFSITHIKNNEITDNFSNQLKEETYMQYDNQQFSGVRVKYIVRYTKNNDDNVKVIYPKQIVPSVTYIGHVERNRNGEISQLIFTENNDL